MVRAPSRTAQNVSYRKTDDPAPTHTCMGPWLVGPPVSVADPAQPSSSSHPARFIGRLASCPIPAAGKLRSWWLAAFVGVGGTSRRAEKKKVACGGPQLSSIWTFPIEEGHYRCARTDWCQRLLGWGVGQRFSLTSELGPSMRCARNRLTSGRAG